jgi:hypothetical protein
LYFPGGTGAKLSLKSEKKLDSSAERRMPSSAELRERREHQKEAPATRKTWLSSAATNLAQFAGRIAKFSYRALFGGF